MQVSSASASPLALTKSLNLVVKGSVLCQVKGIPEKQTSCSKMDFAVW